MALQFLLGTISGGGGQGGQGEFLGGHTVHGERRGHKLSTTEYRERTI